MKSLLTCFIVLAAISVNGQIVRRPLTNKYTLNIPELTCLKTTEDQQDEPYLLLIYQYSNGVADVIRVPEKHWDMYSKGPSSTVVANNLLNITLNKSESIDIICLVMEEDDYSPAMEIGRDILAHLKAGERNLIGVQSDDIKRAIDKRSISFLNTDDWIGSFTLRVKEGGYTSSFRQINNPNGTSAVTTDQAPYKFILTGDGARYEG